MTVIVFPPKPPTLSELVARLEHLVSLNLLKSSSAQAHQGLVSQVKGYRGSILFISRFAFYSNFVDSDFYPLCGFSWQPPVQVVIDAVLRHFLRLHGFYAEWAQMSNRHGARVSFSSPRLAANSKAAQAVIERIEEMPPVASAFDSDVNMDHRLRATVRLVGKSLPGPMLHLDPPLVRTMLLELRLQMVRRNRQNLIVWTQTLGCVFSF